MRGEFLHSLRSVVRHTILTNVSNSVKVRFRINKVIIQNIQPMQTKTGEKRGICGRYLQLGRGYLTYRCFLLSPTIFYRSKVTCMRFQGEMKANELQAFTYFSVRFHCTAFHIWAGFCLKYTSQELSVLRYCPFPPATLSSGESQVSTL